MFFFSPTQMDGLSIDTRKSGKADQISALILLSMPGGIYLYYSLILIIGYGLLSLSPTCLQIIWHFATLKWNWLISSPAAVEVSSILFSGTGYWLSYSLKPQLVSHKSFWMVKLLQIDRHAIPIQATALEDLFAFGLIESILMSNRDPFEVQINY